LHLSSDLFRNNNYEKDGRDNVGANMQIINQAQSAINEAYSKLDNSQRVNTSVNPTFETNSVSAIEGVASPLQRSSVQSVDAPSALINISEQGKKLLANEQAEAALLQASINREDLEQKYKYQLGIEQFVYHAQRYSQQDVAPPMIENRAAIEAYSLVQQKVVASVASNPLEQ